MLQNARYLADRTMAQSLLGFAAMRPTSTSAILVRVVTLATVCFAFGLASQAYAQTNPLGIQVVALDGPGNPDGEVRDTAEEINRGFNNVDCSDPANAKVRLQPVGTDISQEFVDLWLATGSEDCTAEAARNPDMRTCDHVGTADINGTNSEFEVTLSAIDAASEVDICGATSDTGRTVKLFVFATGNEAEEGPVGDSWGVASILVDPTGPGAPTLAATDLAGDNEVMIEWDAVTTGRPRYDVYVGGACGASDPEMAGLLEGSRTSQGATSANVNPEADLGLALGQSVTVYVVAIDEAGNRGSFSQGVCVTRVEVRGFCDVFMEEGGDCEDDGCAAGGSLAPRLPMLMPLALGLMMWRRRRK